MAGPPERLVKLTHARSRNAGAITPEGLDAEALEVVGTLLIQLGFALSYTVRPYGAFHMLAYMLDPHLSQERTAAAHEYAAVITDGVYRRTLVLGPANPQNTVVLYVAEFTRGGQGRLVGAPVSAELAEYYTARSSHFLRWEYKPGVLSFYMKVEFNLKQVYHHVIQDITAPLTDGPFRYDSLGLPIGIVLLS